MAAVDQPRNNGPANCPGFCPQRYEPLTVLFAVCTTVASKMSYWKVEAFCLVRYAYCCTSTHSYDCCCVSAGRRSGAPQRAWRTLYNSITSVDGPKLPYTRTRTHRQHKYGVVAVLHTRFIFGSDGNVLLYSTITARRVVRAGVKVSIICMPPVHTACKQYLPQGSADTSVLLYSSTSFVGVGEHMNEQHKIYTQALLSTRRHFSVQYTVMSASTKYLEDMFT